MTTGHSLPNQGGTTKRMKPSSLTVMGGEGFFYLRLLKRFPAAFSVVRPLQRTVGVRLRDRLPCGLARGTADLGAAGWVGENGGLFEHSDGSVKEEKPWNG